MEKKIEGVINSKYKFTVYGCFGKLFEHKLYDLYREKIDKELSIVETDEDEERDIIEVLKISLENKKDFYTNAKPYMKRKMEQFEKDLEEGTRY